MNTWTFISVRINEKRFLANDHIHDKIADTLQCVILNTLILGAGQTYSGTDPDEDREWVRARQELRGGVQRVKRQILSGGKLQILHVVMYLFWVWCIHTIQNCNKIGTQNSWLCYDLSSYFLKLVLRVASHPRLPLPSPLVNSNKFNCQIYCRKQSVQPIFNLNCIKLENNRPI